MGEIGAFFGDFTGFLGLRAFLGENCFLVDETLVSFFFEGELGSYSFFAGIGLGVLIGKIPMRVKSRVFPLVLSVHFLPSS